MDIRDLDKKELDNTFIKPNEKIDLDEKLNTFELVATSFNGITILIYLIIFIFLYKKKELKETIFSYIFFCFTIALLMAYFLMKDYKIKKYKSQTKFNLIEIEKNLNVTSYMYFGFSFIPILSSIIIAIGQIKKIKDNQ